MTWFAPASRFALPAPAAWRALAACLLFSACTGTSGSIEDDFATEAAGTKSSARYRDLQVVADLPPPENTRRGAAQPVAENDLLEIDVFQVDELDRTAQVDADGNISLPLIGAVAVRDKTIPQIESEIERRYGAKYLQNPEISVFMKESAGLRVTVDGVVMKPGIYPVSSTTTLLQVIAQAGGFQEIADETKLYVFRDFGERKLVANYNVKQIRAGKRPDPRIFGGDVVVSFTSDAKVAARNLREALGMASSAVRLAPI